MAVQAVDPAIRHFLQRRRYPDRRGRSGAAKRRYAHLGHGPPSIQTRKSARARSADAPPLGSSRFVLETGCRCRFSPARNKRLRFATTDLGRHSATAFREGALGWRLLSCRNRSVFRSPIAAPSQTASGETGVARDRRPQGENKKPRGSPPGVELGCSAVVIGRWSIAPALLFTQSDHCIRVGVRQLH